MRALIIKEVTGFMGSLIGSIVILVFLTITGLFLWIFPGNLLDLGYTDLAPLFSLAPWIFMFLVPAVTMRSISEERRTGTMELLLTRPLTEWHIVAAKFIAAVVLVLLALLPTLVHVYALNELGIPKGNMDMGATWGSYLGLFFLAMIFCAIGVFASSLTDSQVIAFLIALLLCFVLYSGFDLMASFDALGGMEGTVRGFGVQEHYRSISRGVVDLRDVTYFLAVALGFLLAARTVLQSRTW
ncbi:MAG: gliding motility-associated ABC transporter permease subunit GldF [Flavobacteriales bacterium]|nr:gliding motility-associated ABC transporter permease subunit GldF [Flavobacteriales bacterium]